MTDALPLPPARQLDLFTDVPVQDVPAVSPGPQLPAATVDPYAPGPTITVAASRLENRWNGSKHIQGDIERSYSGDTLSEGKGHIRPPFLHEGHLYVQVGGMSGGGVCRVTAYRLVSADLFEGEPHEYGEHIPLPSSDPRRFSRHGERVVHKGKACVLSGPPTTFVAAAGAPAAP